MDAMVKRPLINGVSMQVVGGQEKPTEGVLCVSAYFLIFSSRKQTTEDEITVRFCLYFIYLLNVLRIICV